MRFLVDMNLGTSLATWLRDEGHDAVHLRELGLGRLADAEVLSKAAAERRIVVSCDMDFGSLLAQSQARPASVLLLRTTSTRTPRVIGRLRQVLSESGAALESGAIVVVENSRHRVRKLPIGT